MPDLKKLALARDIEQAFKNHLNTDSFPTEEWPALALAFADVVSGTSLEKDWLEAPLVADRAVELQRRMSKLVSALADVMEL